MLITLPILLLIIALLVLAVVGVIYFGKRQIRNHSGEKVLKNKYSKKYEHADVFKKRGLFLLVGLFSTLVFLNAAFNLITFEKVKEVIVAVGDGVGEFLMEDAPARTTQTQELPPPPPPPEDVTEIEEVEDEKPPEPRDTIPPPPPPPSGAATGTGGTGGTGGAPPPPPPPPPPPVDKIYTKVQDYPLFKSSCSSQTSSRARKKCSDGEVIKFLSGQIKYPPRAVDENIEGTVFVEFIIDKAGKMKNLKLIKGVHPLIDREALRVAKLLQGQGAWTPGRQGGKAVKVKLRQPIFFRLK